MSIVFREPDQLLGDILTAFMGIPAGRIVMYDENWEPPKDKGLYIVIVMAEFKPIGVVSTFDPDTQTETMGVSCCQRLLVNITSKDRSAIDRKEEVLMALTSTFSQQIQEAQQVRVTREGDPVDLSFIEGASALHRYQVPVKIFYNKIKTTGVSVIDGFPDPQIVEEA